MKHENQFKIIWHKYKTTFVWWDHFSPPQTQWYHNSSHQTQVAFFYNTWCIICTLVYGTLYTCPWYTCNQFLSEKDQWNNRSRSGYNRHQTRAYNLFGTSVNGTLYMCIWWLLYPDVLLLFNWFFSLKWLRNQIQAYICTMHRHTMYHTQVYRWYTV